ncbi:hypothetical protein Fleli_0164 [Bernardetia litoralis DSM 6794]|uniref:Uncharacterized protein n=1 Tax=Bernardetia litoralis (strain ATCC 23117 / DSM 6794 / NBRC 15988 / NCIMB 1366 / Fx l1 / Sio-4) TaxID=880071 RepID=I4AFC8_BERLS|nr:hypothetical protein [Bernardetia litoralis]AFM02663.1 hypothetical protein Fleli_0164 [Bernardetia litoralis DSM 6794]
MKNYLVFVLFTLLTLSVFSCSKKDEVEISDFMIEVNSDFLLSSQKGYYLFTNAQGDILSEGILENDKQYSIPAFQDETVHFTYFLSEPPNPQLATVVAITFMNIDISHNLVLHGGSDLSDAQQEKGQANVSIECFGGTYYTTIATKTSAVYGVADASFPRTLNLFDDGEEALGLRTTVYPPTSASQFQYAMKNLYVGQENPFLCGDFQDASQKMKSIQIDVGRTRNIGTGVIQLSSIPNGFVSPNIARPFGITDMRSFNFSDSQTATLWYLEDWVKSKREYMKITSQTYDNDLTTGQTKRIYKQSNYGLYPAPSIIRMEIPDVSINVSHNQGISTITQSGEQSLGNIQYQRKGIRGQNEKLYAWILQFEGNQSSIEWVFPKLSNQLYSYLEVEENVFEKEMIPIIKYMSIFEGYKNYNQFIKETFTPYDFKTYNAPVNWQVDYDITEYITNQGGVMYPYEINNLTKLK